MKQEISFDFVLDNVSEKLVIDFDLQNLKIVKVNWISPFYTIFCEFKSNADLNKYWENFISLIALEMSDCLIDDFEKWNVYLFFVSSEKVENILQYKIENDTFFCRKIIPYPFKSIIKNDNIYSLLNKYVLYNDIEVSVKPKTLTPLVRCEENDSESAIFKIINNAIKTNSNETLYSDLYSILKKQQVNKDE